MTTDAVMSFEIILIIAAGAAAVTGVVLIALWPRKGRWGINLSNVSCPRCGRAMPRVRRPRNLRQVLWGGWTCPDCGCEMDKYGKEVPADET